MSATERAIANYVAKVTANAPQLTARQKATLATLLGGGAS